MRCMKAGVLGVAEEDFGPIESFESTFERGDSKLTRCLEVRQTINGEGVTVQRGRAAVQELSEQEKVDIEGGSISVSNRSEKTTKYTEFLLVPGSCVVVDSGSGAFAFDMIGSQAGVQIDRATIDLQGFWEANDRVSPWKAGFYGHQGNAETGVVYGDDVFQDEDFGGGIDSSQLNQLGLDYSPEDDAIKMSVTESGYVEIYQPDNYDEIDFMNYVQSEVLPFYDPRRE